MQIIDAVIMGATQGLSEFLPISSSGHLILLPWFLNFKDPGLTFDVALHFGTLLALLAYFYKDWLSLGKAFISSLSKKRADYLFDEKMSWYLIFASIPGAIGGLLLEKAAETFFRSPLLIAANLAFWGIVLALVDHYFWQKRPFNDLRFKDCLLIGCAQVLALIPGTSRSGITITTGRLLQLDRASAARFSFLLSMPITAGACLMKTKKFIAAGPGLIDFAGIVVSAVVGILAIKYLLQYTRKYSYKIFAYYRVFIALLIVIGSLYFVKA